MSGIPAPEKGDSSDDLESSDDDRIDSAPGSDWTDINGSTEEDVYGTDTSGDLDNEIVYGTDTSGDLDDEIADSSTHDFFPESYVNLKAPVSFDPYGQRILVSETDKGSSSKTGKSNSSTSPAEASDLSLHFALTDLPDLVLKKIVDFLTIAEKVKSELLSEKWQQFVNASLRSHQTLSPGQLNMKDYYYFDTGATRQPDPSDYVKGLLRRMSDPVTNANNLRHLVLKGDLRMLFRNHLNHFEFPKLEELEIEPETYPYRPLPSFVFRCKNLRTVSGPCMSSKDLSRFLTELPRLKKLDIEVYARDAIINVKYPKTLTAKSGLFGVPCHSLESLRINLLPTDGIANLVTSCPGLKELRFVQDELAEGIQCNFRPLGNIGLRLLEIECQDVGGKKPLEQISAALTSDSPLSRELKEFIARFPTDYFSDTKLLRSLASCRNLRVLHFRGCDDYNSKFHNRISVGSILTAENFPSLEELSLHCIKLDGFSKGDVFDLPLLKQLLICPCPKQSDAVLSHFVAKVIRTCSLLEKLHLPGRNFKDAFFSGLSEFLSQGPSSSSSDILSQGPDSSSSEILSQGPASSCQILPQPSCKIVIEPNRKMKCSSLTGGLEARARCFGLNLKFSILKNNCGCEDWME